MIKFSVLLSLYDKESPQYLKEALISVFNQSLMPDQVVLVLDGPINVDLRNVLDYFSKNFDTLELYPLESNGGLSAALRYGLEKCRNEIVFRMDTDDVCYPSRFEDMLRLYEMHPDLDVAGSFATTINENGASEKILKVPTSKSDIYNKVWACPFIHPSVSFKKSSLQKVGSYAECPGPRQDDYELWFRVIKGGLNCMNIDKPLLFYRFTSGNVARNDIRVGWARLKVGIKGAWMCKCSPIAYIGVAYPLFRSLMPSFVRGCLYKMSDKFNPRVK